MTHKKWEPGTLYAKAMRDITNEHNATVDAWQAAEAEAERLGRANSDLCDQIEARKRIAELESPTRVPFSDARVEALARVLRDSYCKYYGISADGELPDHYMDHARVALAHITPVGWELGVTADEAWAAYNAYGPGGIKAVLDLCRARIRPVFECKECAKWETYGKKMEDNARVLARRIDAVRAAMEGES